MATTLIRNAQAIVTVDREDRVLRNGNILVEDNIIRYIGPAERAADRVIDASHCFVYPGLVNTHHHLYQTFTRNLPQVQKMELFPWLRTLYEIWRGLDEDCIYNSSLVGLGELLKYGCTTCMDHHYVFPKVGSEHFIDQQFRAADQLGVRFHATRGSMSRGRSDGGLPPDDLGSGCGYHPEGQPAAGGKVPRHVPIFHAPGGAGPVLALQRYHRPAEAVGSAGPVHARAAAHPSVRDQG